MGATQRSRTTRPGGPKPGFFDLWSRVYDAPLVQRLTYRPIHDAVVPQLRALRPKRVLDLGCGTGLLSARLRRELRGVSVTGCDFSSGMLAQARRRRAGVAWVRGTAMALPFADRSFDAVVATESFHWFPDQQEALAGIYRALAPGGCVLLGMATPATPWLGAATRAGSRLLGEPLSFPTRSGLRALLRQGGFLLESQERILRLPAPLAFPAYLTVGRRPG